MKNQKPEIWTVVQNHPDEGTLPWPGLFASLDEAKQAVMAEICEVYETESCELSQVLVSGPSIHVYEASIGDGLWFFTRHA